ncbi:MAG: tagaturonate reductase [Bacteroidota bacterium]
MKHLDRSTFPKKGTYPERILQFGEGNFLRAFADWMVHEMNQKTDFGAGVVVVQPIAQGLVPLLNKQDGRYTLYLNGIKNGVAVSENQLIDCIQRGIDPYRDYGDFLRQGENPDLRFVFSNTTEAGIVYKEGDGVNDAPPSSFPAKLTALLHKRFQVFSGATDKGLIIVPCELIARNGDNLKKIVVQYAREWNLGDTFLDWVNTHIIFCNTLVDRIVPGYPKDKMDAITQELGYRDSLVVEGEQFHLWVIEGPKTVQREFPATEAGLNVIFTDNMEPYRTRKVRILNGAHTSLVPVGYLYGIDKVRESLENPVVGHFLKEVIFSEIIPTLDLPEEELKQFAHDVLDRFKNPYLEHALISISLNSISKFKTRVLPSLLEYIKRKQSLPDRLLFSLAALIVFYRGDRQGASIPLKDDASVLEFFKVQWAKDDVSQTVRNTLSNKAFWGEDLASYPGLQEKVEANVTAIMEQGVGSALQSLQLK